MALTDIGLLIRLGDADAYITRRPPRLYAWSLQVSCPQPSELEAHHGNLDVVELAKQISDCQARLMRLSEDKTRRLEQTQVKQVPDVSKGIRNNRPQPDDASKNS